MHAKVPSSGSHFAVKFLLIFTVCVCAHVSVLCVCASVCVPVCVIGVCTLDVL